MTPPSPSLSTPSTFEDADGNGEPARRAIALDGQLVYADATHGDRVLSVGAAVVRQKLKRPSKQKRAGACGADAPPAAATKVLRPSEWRLDRAAGLTLPRVKRPRPAVAAGGDTE